MRLRWLLAGLYLVRLVKFWTRCRPALVITAHLPALLLSLELGRIFASICGTARSRASPERAHWATFIAVGDLSGGSPAALARKYASSRESGFLCFLRGQKLAARGDVSLSSEDLHRMMAVGGSCVGQSFAIPGSVSRSVAAVNSLDVAAFLVICR